MLTKVKNVLDITADTVADLANVQHKTGSIQLLGFHTKGDGGGGVFYWDATKDKSEHNGGTIIDPSIAGLVANWEYTQNLYFTPAVIGQGCWVREYSGAVNVKWFGAKGDGVTDDTLAIQKTFDVYNTVEMTNNENTVYLLKDSIILTVPFVLNGNSSKVKVEHTGVGFKIESNHETASEITRAKSIFERVEFIKHTTSAPTELITIGTVGYVEPINITIQQVQFNRTNPTNSHIVNIRGYGNSIKDCGFNTTTGTAVYVSSGIGGDESKYSYDFLIDNCDISGAENGVVIEGGKVFIQNCVIESVSAKAVWNKGIGFNPTIIVKECYFENNGYSFYYESQEPQGYVRDAVIENCYFSSNSGKNYFSTTNTVTLRNNKGFSLINVDASSESPNIKITDSGYEVAYDPNITPNTLLDINTSYYKNLGFLAATEFSIPYSNINVPSATSGYKGSFKVEITARSGNNSFRGVYLIYKKYSDISAPVIEKVYESGWILPTIFTKDSDLKLYAKFDFGAYVSVSVSGTNG
jgi:hypothetical protein